MAVVVVVVVVEIEAKNAVIASNATAEGVVDVIATVNDVAVAASIAIAIAATHRTSAADAATFGRWRHRCNYYYSPWSPYSVMLCLVIHHHHHHLLVIVSHRRVSGRRR